MTNIQEALIQAASDQKRIIDEASSICVISDTEFDAKTCRAVYRYRCAKGFWSVEGSDMEYVKGQALHYFMQYYADGEYADLISQAFNKEKTSELPY